jgi:hypothetical protein
MRLKAIKNLVGSLCLLAGSPALAAVLTGISPDAADVGSPALTLTVTGTDFLPDAVVRFRGEDRPTAFIDSTTLTAQVEEAALSVRGIASVVVVSPTGGETAPLEFSVNLIPQISSIDPGALTAGSGDTTIEVRGLRFGRQDAVVRWNGQDRQTVFVTDELLQALIPASDLASAGDFPVTVVNLPPAGGLSNEVTVTVAPAQNPAPAIADVSPGSASVGDAGMDLTVTGSGFIPDSRARWNGEERQTTYVGAGELRFSISSGDLASPGNANVDVFNPAPGGGTSNARTFVVMNLPAPAITSLQPDASAAGSSDLTLEVNGSGFVPGSVVRWNGDERPTTFVGPERLNASIPAADLASGGSVPVTVFNPAPTNASSDPLSFTIFNPLVSLSAITPESAVVGSAGFTLTVNGNGFTTDSVVRWNGRNTPTTFVNSGSLTARISSSDLSSRRFVPVTVFTPAPGGGLSPAQAFAVNLVPAAASLEPSLIQAGSGEFLLRISGANFATDSVIRVNGGERPTTFINATTLTALIPASDVLTPAAVPIEIFNPDPGGLSEPLLLHIAGQAGSDRQEGRSYPNPWRADQHGASGVFFDRWTPGSRIKIFTLSGKWVKNIDVEQGTAVWDLTNEAQEPVASGYYLYLVTDADGSGKRGKIAVIR